MYISINQWQWRGFAGGVITTCTVSQKHVNVRSCECHLALDLFRFMSYITQKSYRWSNIFYVIIVSQYHILLIIPNLSDQGAQRLGERKHEVRSCVRQLQNSFTRKKSLQIKRSEKLHLMNCEELLKLVSFKMVLG